MVIFLFISLISLYPSNIAVSYGQAGFYSDSPLIASTTDCMASMMTSTIVGSPQDCTENISKVIPPSDDVSNVIKPENSTPNVIKPENSTPNSMDNPNSLSKNNPFYSEFQNTNADTSSLPSASLDSPDNGFANTDSASPPADNPSTSMSSQQQIPNSSYVTPASPIESLDGVNNTNTSSSEINELGNVVDKNNENGEEISGCFDRASVTDASLSNSEIIKCAEDHESFSNDNNVNLDVADEEKPDGNNDESDNARIKEISSCFDRAFVPDANLSDLEIIKCAEDRDSFSNENSANLDVADDGKTDGNDGETDNDGNDGETDNDGKDSGDDNDGNDE
jgi:hypothetical protein